MVARWHDERRVRLGDVDPTGRMWLDSVAGFVQDAAADHSDHNGFAGSTWVVRRLRLRCVRLPQHREVVDVSTWCSGVGPRWAERTTTLSVDGHVGVEAVAVWVHLDPSTGAPAPLPEVFTAVYGETITSTRVSARLAHDDPPAPGDPGTVRSMWPVRRSDLDLLGHVNNARYWSAVEEVLSARGVVLGPGVPVEATIEFPAGLDHEPATIVHRDAPDGSGAGVDVWVLDSTGSVAASVTVRALLRDGADTVTAPIR